MVPRRQSASVAPLLAIPFPAVEGALRGHSNAGLWPSNRLSQGLKSQRVRQGLADREPDRGQPKRLPLNWRHSKSFAASASRLRKAYYAASVTPPVIRRLAASSAS